MLKNYLILAVRNILRHKVYSIINIAGLSVGMACSILILLWVQYELGFDRYHEKAERIYRLGMDLDIGNWHKRMAISSNPAGPALKKDYPEVLNFARFRGSGGSILVQYKDQKFLEKPIKDLNNPTLLKIWRMLTTSDHLYYISQADAGPGEVHSYFSHYNTPIEAFANYNEIISDLTARTLMLLNSNKKK